MPPRLKLGTEPYPYLPKRMCECAIPKVLRASRRSGVLIIPKSAPLLNLEGCLIDATGYAPGLPSLKVLPWVVDGAGGLGAGKTSGAGTRGVDLNAAIGGRTGDSDTNGGESSNNGSKIHVECYPAENPSL